MKLIVDSFDLDGLHGMDWSGLRGVVVENGIDVDPDKGVDAMRAAIKRHFAERIEAEGVEAGGIAFRDLAKPKREPRPGELRISRL